MSKISEAHEFLLEWCKNKDVKIELSPDNWMNILECMGDYKLAKENVVLDNVVFSEAELKAKLEEQKEETRQWLIDEDFEGLAERL